MKEGMIVTYTIQTDWKRNVVIIDMGGDNHGEAQLCTVRKRNRLADGTKVGRRLSEWIEKADAALAPYES